MDNDKTDHIKIVINSTSGRPNAIYDDYVYNIIKEQSSKTLWVCIRRTCGSILETNGLLVTLEPPHNHCSDNIVTK
jgi:hypothetical protein